MKLARVLKDSVKNVKVRVSKTRMDIPSQAPTYNSSIIAKVVVDKNKTLSDKLKSGEFPSLDFILIRPLLVFALTEKKSLNVLDLGGGGGTHYHVVKKILSKEVNMNWAVVETPHMIAAAQNVFKNDLTYFAGINEAIEYLGVVDIVLASGVLQYLEDPIQGLRDLMNCNPDYIFITRTALTTNESSLRAIHKTRLKDNGPGPLPETYDDVEIQYPLTVVSKNLFVNTISEKYKIICEILEDSFVHKIDGTDIHQYGYLCERK
jgi:putative methyltransferase (TIGR04325 family)